MTTRKAMEIEKEEILDNLLFSWDRQPGENAMSYKLFTAFREMGSERSYKKVCEMFPDRKYNAINQMGARLQWFKRADEWDSYKREKMQRELDEEILYARIRQQRIGKSMQLLGEKGLTMLQEYPEELTAADLSKLIDIGTKIERLALGDPTNISKTESKVEAKIEVEEIPKEVAEKVGKELAIMKSAEMEINV